MRKFFKNDRVRGFTLVELLVVIAIIGILVSIVMPAITDALMRGRLTQMAANGRNLVQQLMAQSTQDIYTSQAVVWPRSGGSDPDMGQFQHSTEYFHWLVTNEIMNVNFNYFAGPGVPAAPSETEFITGTPTGRYNAWCIVGDVTARTAETTPVLFTRNLGSDAGIDTGGQSYTELDMDVFQTDDTMSQLFVGEPFQNRGFVFVTKGGAAFAPFKDDMRVRNFTNIFKIYRDRDDTRYPVLRPGSSG